MSTLYLYLFPGPEILAGPDLCYRCVFFPLARAKNPHPSSRFRSPTGITRRNRSTCLALDPEISWLCNCVIYLCCLLPPSQSNPDSRFPDKKKPELSRANLLKWRGGWVMNPTLILDSCSLSIQIHKATSLSRYSNISSTLSTPI